MSTPKVEPTPDPVDPYTPETVYYTIAYDPSVYTTGLTPYDSTNYTKNQQAHVLPSGSMKNGNYPFLHWNTRSDDTGTAFEPDAIVTAGSAPWTEPELRLYAIWSGAQVIPDGEPIEKFYWGSWIRMDQDISWYISSNGYKNESDTYSQRVPADWTSNTGVGFGTISIEKHTDNMIKVLDPMNANMPEYYMFRKSGANARANLGVNDNNAVSAAIRSAARGLAGLGSVKIMLQNKKNEGDSQGQDGSLTADAEGNVALTDLTAGDTYTVTVPTQSGVETPVSVEVTPQFDGQNLGFITVGKVDNNFKVSYRIEYNPDNGGNIEYNPPYLFANRTYKLELVVQNVGTKELNQADYEITPDTGAISLAGALFTGTLGSLAPREGFKTITYTLSANPLTNESLTTEIPILITGSDGTQWKDLVNLKFYRESARLWVRSAEKQVQGIIISPERQSTPFKTESDNYWQDPDTQLWHYTYKGSIDIPVRAAPYTLALSGAGYTNEAAYAVKLGSSPATDGRELTTTSNNEPNDSETETTPLYLEQSRLGYLGKGDLDFYTVYPYKTNASIEPVDEELYPFTISPANPTVNAGGSILLSADNQELSTGGTDWQWTVDGLRDSNQTGPTFTFATAGKTAGDYPVSVTMHYGENTFSASTIVTVTDDLEPKMAFYFNQTDPLPAGFSTWVVEYNRWRSLQINHYMQSTGSFTFTPTESISYLSFDYGGVQSGNQHRLYIGYNSQSQWTELPRKDSVDFNSSVYKQVSIPAGVPYTLYFKYEKSWYSTTNYDYMWIDNLRLY